MDLPIDPAEWAGTPEHQEIQEELAHRAYLLRLASMEEMQERQSLRRSSYHQS